MSLPPAYLRRELTHPLPTKSGAVLRTLARLRTTCWPFLPIAANCANAGGTPLFYDAQLDIKAIVPLVAAIILGGIVIWVTPATVELETRKVRLAGAVLVALLALFIFSAILYFVDAGGAGKEIFDKASPVIFALVGTIIGYIFGARATRNPSADQ